MLPSLVKHTLVLVIALALGCGGAGSSLHGTVHLDGVPLPSGDVNLVPVPGSPGTTAGALIEEGRFVIAADRGPTPGTYKVIISATRLVGKKYASTDPVLAGQEVQDGEQYIPRRYNTHTELTVEIKPGRNQAAFELSTK